MVGIWGFIPHHRVLEEDTILQQQQEFEHSIHKSGSESDVVESIDENTEKNDKEILISKRISSDNEKEHENENNLEVEIQDFDVDYDYVPYKFGEKTYKIREIRDEANRPWWKVFDEFEYRNTKSEAKSYKWYKWFPEGTSSAEKKLLVKLDIFLAFYSFVGYWVKYVDSANLNNAYVSGMKENLGMKGNDLINTQTVFTVGQIVFEIPWIFLLPRIPITYGLTIAELFWAAFTIGTYRVKTVSALQAIRFFVGASEAAYFPCIHFLLGSWYLPHEVGRRGALFYIGQFLGVLTSGLLQSATFKNLSGNGGLEGWRWMFIVDGGISFGVALLAFICIPGTPAKCYSLFLTDDEIRLARRRMKKNGTDVNQSTKALFDLPTWKKAFSTWHVYFLGFINILGFNSNNTSSGSFVLWLKSLKKYDTVMINNLSTVPPALGILYVLIICVGADITRKRFLFVSLSFLLNFIGNTILAVWDVSYGAKWFAFCFGYWSWSQSSVFNPLISDFFRKDTDVRAVAWMAIYIIGLQSSAWIGRLIWPTTASPRFHVGFSTCAAFSIGFAVFIGIAYFFYKNDERRESLENGIYLYNSETGDIPQFVLDHPEFVEKNRYD
ncbi:hypothetical protein C6P40_003574 [Pichia californica]|uniref:Major facilitator superfamily (MFS) profile domain-containing protein n=1 Tax=Pichia californica TaxID=460514 RepID=A0A9P6WIH4_9ASCO|nr:hypothetical protein C6P42_003301 [[Candida] californica]KAG0686683.1 hypothetical protein C6P40_003574 [[Candida] californica]